ncbi:hypothetical protein AOLI_G00206040 [Acnodon oligacanthus]
MSAVSSPSSTCLCWECRLISGFHVFNIGKLLINYSSARLCTYPLQYSICAEAARLTRIVQLEDDPGGDLSLHLPRCLHTPNHHCSR